MILSGDNYANRIDIGDGGGTMFFEGGGLTKLQGMNRAMRNGGAGTYARGPSFIGQTTSGNTINVEGANGKLIVSCLRIGMGSNGNNTLNITSPGTESNPSVWFMGNVGNDPAPYGGNAILGDYSSNNAITIGAGAVLRHQDKGFILGTQSGSNNNSITISGAGAILNHSTTGGSLEVGRAGNNNYILVQSGGTLKPGRMTIGSNGGTDNWVRVTGAGSAITDFSGQQRFAIGTDLGGSVASSRNYLQVDSGGYCDAGSSTNARGYDLGSVDGANDNYIKVDSVGSWFQLRHNQPLGVGGRTGTNNNSNFITDSTASGNYIEVINGGEARLNAVYLMGNKNGDGDKTASKFVLGNGTAVSTPSKLTLYTFGGNAMYNKGITLYNSGTRLYVNNGKIVTSSDTAVISGGPATSGQVVLNGPFIVDTGANTNTISVAIAGGTGTAANETLEKQGTGKLTLSGAASHHGATTVSGGTLALAPRPSSTTARRSPSHPRRPWTSRRSAPAATACKPRPRRP